MVGSAGQGEIIQHGFRPATRRDRLAVGAGIAAACEEAGSRAAFVYVHRRAETEIIAMKTRTSSPTRRQDGVAIVVILAMLVIMLLYVAANVRALDYLGRELKLLEQRQVQRLNSSTAPTNSVSGTNAPASQPPSR